MKKEGKEEEAREKVRTAGVPLWLRLAPEVRKAVLSFQRIVATRNDLGTLASMHNKLVRLSLVRLRMSMKEYLGKLPVQTEDLYARVTRPDNNAAPRLFVPTRPTFLASGEQVRVLVVCTGPGPVKMHTRTLGSDQWTTTEAQPVGRKTHQVVLGSFPAGGGLAEYYFSAGDLAAPPGAPRDNYMLTLL